MRTLQPRASRGMRQVTAGLRSLDDEVFDAIANSESPLFDKTDASALPRRRSRPAVVRDRSGHSDVWGPVCSACRGPRCGQSCGDKPGHQPGGQADVAPQEAVLSVRSAAAAPAQVSEVQFTAVRPLRKRCCLRGRRGDGEPDIRAC